MLVRRELLNLPINWNTDGLDVISLSKLCVVGCAEVQACPENSRFLRLPVQPITYTVAVYHVHNIAIRSAGLHVGMNVLDGVGHLRLFLGQVASRILIPHVVSMAVRDVRIKNISQTSLSC